VKFTVDRIRFAEAVAWVARAADTSHGVQPIMAGLLIDADGETGVLSLAANDYELASRATIPAIILEGGDGLLPAALLHKVCEAADGDEVEVVAEETAAVITCGEDSWELALMPAYDYPSLPEAGEPVGWVDAELLQQAFKQVGGAVGKGKGAQVEHTGVFVEVANEVMSLAATNRYQIAATELSWKPVAKAVECGAIVPPRLLADFTGSATGRVGVAFVRGYQDKVTMVSLSGEGRVSTVRVIDGQFPNWRNYFANAEMSFEAMRAEGTATAMTVETDALMRALKKAGTVLGGGGADAPPPTLRLALSGKGIRLTGGNTVGTLARSASTVAADVDGEDVEVSLNLGYLLNALIGLRSPVASVSIYGAVKPVLIGPVGDGPASRHMIQPYRAA